MRLTKNFSLEEMVRSETAARLGINNEPGTIPMENMKRLAEAILQPLRDAYGKPIIVSSGYRSPALNKAVGGVPNSQHQYGQAADIQAPRKCPKGEDGKTWDYKRENRRLFELIQELRLPYQQLINENGYSWIQVSGPRK